MQNHRSADVLVTGAAGFIGFHLVKRLLDAGRTVIGLDNLNSYYDVALKEERLKHLEKNHRFGFVRGDIADAETVMSVFDAHRPRVVVHLAAQAGVRYSLENPSVYIQSNIVGFANILEGCRQGGVVHLLYASSSSVYGGNNKVPFSESDPVDHPVSLYAATKRSNELMADTYAHLYGVPMTGLRFFTVYGPLGRPDMAYFSFADRHFAGDAIKLFRDPGTGSDLSRDFTFVDDVVESVLRLISEPPSGERPHRILNVGGSRPVALTEFVAILEASLSDALQEPVEFVKTFVGPQAGDVHTTYADSKTLSEIIGYVPETALIDGLRKFADWYVGYRGIARRGD